MHYSTILFDLDGTLTDPKVGITKSVRYALQKFQIQVQDLDELISFIGPPLSSSFQEFYGMSPEEAKQAVAFYREYFTVKGMYENKLYEGIVPLLEQLAGQGRRLLVATSKPKVFAETILQHFDIAKYFQGIYGSQLDGGLTDKAELIRHIIDQEQLDREETLMIGDRKYDVIGAQNNGIASIGVGYGYGSEAELTAAGPTYYVPTLEALEKLLLGRA